MNWNRQDQTITAHYQDQTVTGRVESSRVKYGGQVQHTLILDHAAQFQWRTEPTTRLLIDERDVIFIHV